MTNTPPRELTQPRVKGQLRSWITQSVSSVEVWIVLSLVFILLTHLDANSQGASWAWPLDPALSIAILVVLRVERYYPFRHRLRLSRWSAALAFLALSWSMGMLYEFTLSQAPGKYGGMHPTTVGSFVIAQGQYVPLAVLGLWIVRRYHLNFYELFYVAGMTSLYEAITVGIPYLLSAAFFVSPVIIAYYFVVYTRFLSTGLLIVEPHLLWDQSQRTISTGRKMLYGTLLGIACWIIFVVWGESVIYLFRNFEGYP